MPQITIGNEAHLRALSDDDLKQLSQTVRMELVRRRVVSGPDEYGQVLKIDRRLRYVSWEDVKEILLPHYGTEHLASHYASCLWSELYLKTCRGMIHMEGHCSICETKVKKRKTKESWTIHRIGCPSRSRNTARTIVFTRRSLLASRDAVMAIDNMLVPQRIKDDYQRVIDGLTPKRKPK